MQKGEAMNAETYLPFYERRRRALTESNRCEKFYEVADDARVPEFSRAPSPALPFYRRHLPVTEKVVFGVVGAASGVVAAGMVVFMCAALLFLGCAACVMVEKGGSSIGVR
jgi:hypothetical protein